MHRGWAGRAARYLRLMLPAGGTLSDAERHQRHRAILWLLWLHVPALLIFSLCMGNDVQHSLTEAAALLPWAIAATSSRLTARMRSATASLGLLTASAILVHLAGGAIEAHFHIFVIISVIALSRTGCRSWSRSASLSWSTAWAGC
jgi:hypothetical protein